MDGSEWKRQRSDGIARDPLLALSSSVHSTRSLLLPSVFRSPVVARSFRYGIYLIRPLRDIRVSSRYARASQNADGYPCASMLDDSAPRRR